MKKNEASPLYYGDYLQLSKILQAQHLRSGHGEAPAHDEMLFIITHQAYELWFKQILHEIESLLVLFGKETIDDRDLGKVVARLQRVIEILRVLIDQLNILETMTPMDFLDFRHDLVPASGFQSAQFRILEVKLGLPIKGRSQVEEHYLLDRFSPEDRNRLTKLESEASLLRLIEKWLERIPFLEIEQFNFWQLYEKAVEEMLQKDRQIIMNNQTLSDQQREEQLREWQLTKENFQGLTDAKLHENIVQQGKRRLSQKATLAALFINLYRDEPILSAPFQILTSLVDIDEHLTTWRYRHAMMAHRMLGSKIGTGGSSGAQYLKQAADRNRIFLDFYNLSTFLLPRASLPALPAPLKSQLGFHFSQTQGRQSPPQ